MFITFCLFVFIAFNLKSISVYGGNKNSERSSIISNPSQFPSANILLNQLACQSLPCLALLWCRFVHHWCFSFDDNLLEVVSSTGTHSRAFSLRHKSYSMHIRENLTRLLCMKVELYSDTSPCCGGFTTGEMYSSVKGVGSSGSLPFRELFKKASFLNNYSPKGLVEQVKHRNPACSTCP